MCKGGKQTVDQTTVRQGRGTQNVFKLKTYFAFILFLHLIISHTHREHTPGAVGSHFCCGAFESGCWGFGAQGSHLSHDIEGGRERCTFTPPTDNSCQYRDLNPQPMGYKSISLTIRPQLPLLLPKSVSSVPSVMAPPSLALPPPLQTK